jgi:crossover junction endodeoxyribonuclease RuvC
VIIFGIDPGLTATGYGIITVNGNRIAPLSWGVIRSGGGELPDRLAHIYNELRRVLDEHKPDIVAVEDIFIGKSPSSALKMGHARGVALLAAANGGYPVREYPTAVIKQSVVGGGRAAKQQVGFMVRRLLALGEAKLAEDAADALAAALCCVIKGDFPTMVNG